MICLRMFVDHYIYRLFVVHHPGRHLVEKVIGTRMVEFENRIGCEIYIPLGLGPKAGEFPQDKTKWREK